MLLLAPQVAKNKAELLELLRNMALGLMPETLRSPDAPQPEPQDFLIRGMALDKSGFMVVGDAVRVGQRIRFMVSDRFVVVIVARSLPQAYRCISMYDCHLINHGTWGCSASRTLDTTHGQSES